MANSPKASVQHWCEYLGIRITLGLLSILPFRWRGALIARIARLIVPLAAGPRRRMMRNLELIYPQMPTAEKRKLIQDVASNAARALSELLMNKSYRYRHDLFDATGPGLQILQEQARKGKGAIIVSAHFGQWEAIRHFLKKRGMETGAIYRKNSNPLYEDLFLHNIQFGGSPIVPRGPAGNRTMVKHLKAGGFFALLVDQKVHADAMVPFMGVAAQTTTSPAALALKYDLPIVPAFAARLKDGISIEIEFQEPIKPSDILTMTQDINDRIGEKVKADPSQWYWMHKRWESPEISY
ncbi:MAG: amino acid ABC transporter substrate-binding protein [Pseudomonadota bacterium]